MMAVTDTTIDTTQQVTSKVPVTSVKNPKRVAAGKRIAEKKRLAQEEQKKKIAEADVIVANEQLRKAQEEAKKVDESPPETTKVSQTLTTTQWLSVISIGISLLGIYYKREEIKNALSKIKAPASATPAPASDMPAPESAPAPLPVDRTPKKRHPFDGLKFFIEEFITLYTMISEAMIRASAVVSGSELFSLLTCPHTTTFTLLSIFSPLEMNSIKIWETIRSKNANCSLPVAVRVSKTRVLKLPIRDLTQNTMATATRTSPNKRLNEKNNGCARTL